MDYDDDRSRKSSDGDIEIAVPTGRKRDVRYRGKDGSEATREKVILKLRACLVCRIILSEDQFYEDGCPNCTHLHMDGNQAAINECTTLNFNGMIALLKPETSWVARFNKLTNRIPGCYAASAVGELPESLKEEMAYDQRDGDFER